MLGTAGCLLALSLPLLFIVALFFGFGDYWTGSSGIVRTADGSPIVDAEVVLTLENGSESRSDRSHADGNYSVIISTRAHWNRRAKLDVSAKGYRTNSRTIEGGMHVIDVVMEPVRQ